jgi:hypothetical protein
VAEQRGVASLPWKLVEGAITGAMNSGFIRVRPGGTTWPCQPHEASTVQFSLPEATDGKKGQRPSGSAEDQEPAPKPKSTFREALLDSSQMTELVEGMDGVLAAAGNLTLRFRVLIEFAEGEIALPEVEAKLSAALDRLNVGFG